MKPAAALALLATGPALAKAADMDPSVQLFEWSWEDVSNECESFLGPKGFRSVQISPPMEHIQGPAWWTRYQPVSYNLISRSGNETQFADMVSRCEKAGVAIIADAVINHMAAGSGIGVGGSSYGNRAYPVYSQNDFHHYENNWGANCEVNDYSDKYNVQYCDLVGLPDLATGSAYVQDTVAGYINKMAGYGVAGIRIDAAKHQDAGEMSGITNKIDSSLYVNQEVIGSSGEAVSPSEYYSIGHVTEFAYSSVLDPNIINENKMKYLETFGESWGLMPSDKACAFLDNHDTQRNGQAALTYKSDLYSFANIFMLAWPYGDVRLMSSYYFTDTDAGPPSVGVNNGANCGNGRDWVCEHRVAGVANMVKWRHVAGKDSKVEHFQHGNDNQIAFSRGGSAFVALNRDPTSAWQARVYTGLPSGEYCDVIHSLDSDDPSTCSQTVHVDSSGNADIAVPAKYGVAIHVGAKR